MNRPAVLALLQAVRQAQLRAIAHTESLICELAQEEEIGIPEEASPTPARPCPRCGRVFAEGDRSGDVRVCGGCNANVNDEGEVIGG